MEEKRGLKYDNKSNTNSKEITRFYCPEREKHEEAFLKNPNSATSLGAYLITCLQDNRSFDYKKFILRARKYIELSPNEHAFYSAFTHFFYTRNLKHNEFRSLPEDQREQLADIFLQIYDTDPALALEGEIVIPFALKSRKHIQKAIKIYKKKWEKTQNISHLFYLILFYSQQEQYDKASTLIRELINQKHLKL
ncbi:hypothetical protein JXA85_02260, partial [Candidatus Woesearchaeota archaeon]|nr:hypothetical protein [Candidatus Woesearchaeota archaeon]